MPATRHTHLRNPGAPVRLFIANRRFTREPSAPGVSPGSAARSHVTAHAELRAWPPHLPSPRPPKETPSGATPHETRASFPSQRVSPCSETKGNHVAPLGHREGGRVTVGVTSLASLLSGGCACRLVGGTESFLPGRLPNNSSNTGMATHGFPHEPSRPCSTRESRTEGDPSRPPTPPCRGPSGVTFYSKTITECGSTRDPADLS